MKSADTQAGVSWMLYLFLNVNANACLILNMVDAGVSKCQCLFFVDFLTKRKNLWPSLR